MPVCVAIGVGEGWVLPLARGPNGKGGVNRECSREHHQQRTSRCQPTHCNVSESLLGHARRPGLPLTGTQVRAGHDFGGDLLVPLQPVKVKGGAPPYGLGDLPYDGVLGYYAVVTLLLELHWGMLAIHIVRVLGGPRGMYVRPHTTVHQRANGRAIVFAQRALRREGDLLSTYQCPSGVEDGQEEVVPFASFLLSGVDRGLDDSMPMVLPGLQVIGSSGAQVQHYPRVNRYNSVSLLQVTTGLLLRCHTNHPLVARDGGAPVPFFKGNGRRSGL